MGWTDLKAKFNKARQEIGQKPLEYINKATNKFASLPAERQVRIYYDTISAPGLKFVMNLRAKLLEGMATGYIAESNDGQVPVSVWLKPYTDVPLFEKVLKKSNVTLDELVAVLKHHEKSTGSVV